MNDIERRAIGKVVKAWEEAVRGATYKEIVGIFANRGDVQPLIAILLRAEEDQNPPESGEEYKLDMQLYRSLESVGEKLRKTIIDLSDLRKRLDNLEERVDQPDWRERR